MEGQAGIATHFEGSGGVWGLEKGLLPDFADGKPANEG
jgi:hypothetical protein